MVMERKTMDIRYTNFGRTSYYWWNGWLRHEHWNTETQNAVHFQSMPLKLQGSSKELKEFDILRQRLKKQKVTREDEHQHQRLLQLAVQQKHTTLLKDLSSIEQWSNVGTSTNYYEHGIEMMVTDNITLCMYMWIYIINIAYLSGFPTCPTTNMIFENTPGYHIWKLTFTVLT